MLRHIALKNIKLMTHSKKFYSKLKSDEYLDNLFGKYKRDNMSYLSFGCDINRKNNVFEVKYSEMGGYNFATPKDIIEDVNQTMEFKKMTTKPQLLVARGTYGFDEEFFKYFEQDVEYLDLCNTELYNRDVEQIFNGISNFKKLKYLFLRNLHISKIPHNLPKSLLYLDLGGNYLKNYENINNYPNLKGLVIGDSFDDKTNEYFGKQIVDNIEYLDIRTIYNWKKEHQKIDENQIKFTKNFKNLKHLITENSQTRYDTYW